MDCRLFGAKPLSKPTPGYCQLDPQEQTSAKFFIKIKNFSITKMYLNISSAKWQPFCPEGDELSHSLNFLFSHYDDVIMDTIASQITSLTIVYSIAYSGTDQRKHQSSASLAFVRGIHRGPVNSPHKGPVTRKMFPFDDVIMLHPPKLSAKSDVRTWPARIFRANMETPTTEAVIRMNSKRFQGSLM